MAKIICLKIKRRGDFFRLGAQILRRFMGFYSLIEDIKNVGSVIDPTFFMSTESGVTD